MGSAGVRSSSSLSGLQTPKLPQLSGILVQQAFIDAHFRKAWMPYPVVTPRAFLDFVGDHIRQEAFLDFSHSYW